METVEELKSIKGEVRAVTLYTDKLFIRKNKGENGIILVENELKKMGFPIEYNNIKSPTEFYPIKLRVASLLAIKKHLI